MITIEQCCERDFKELAEIWERSVRATHHFLTEGDIQEIREALIPLYFPAVTLYAIKDPGRITGFIGLSGNKIEMLFIDSSCRGRGYGSRLIDFAIESGATLVDVNEQNPEAVKFYLAKGFAITARDETDDAGRPFPILHLSLR